MKFVEIIQSPSSLMEAARRFRLILSCTHLKKNNSSNFQRIMYFFTEYAIYIQYCILRNLILYISYHILFTPRQDFAAVRAYIISVCIHE